MRWVIFWVIAAPIVAGVWILGWVALSTSHGYDADGNMWLVVPFLIGLLMVVAGSLFGMAYGMYRLVRKLVGR